MDTAPTSGIERFFRAKEPSQRAARGQHQNRMKTIWNVALATIALAGMSGAAHADLNQVGEVGLPLNPTAQIPQAGGFRLQGNYYDAGRAFGGTIREYSVGGAIRAGQKLPLEVSGNINYSNGAGSNKKTLFGIGAKYLFSRENDPIGVRLAVGAGYGETDGGFLLGNLRNYHAYAVATKSLGQLTQGRVPITGHLGLRYDNYKASGFNGTNRASVYLGAEVPVTPTGEVQVLGEIGTKVIKGGGSPYSAGLRYRPTQQPFGATIGIQRQGVLDNKGRIFIQIGYTFGGR